MESDARAKFLPRLAERGLSVKSFEDQTLTVSYDPSRDSEAQKGHTVDKEALAKYVREVILQLPGFEGMFPRLQRVAVEVSPPRDNRRQ
jgi:hypothetical protein